MNRAVIFDFDGVIINSSEVQRQALLESYRLVVGDGYPSYKEFFSHSGDSLENIFRKMNLPLQMVEPYRKFSRERIDYINVYDGMKELIISLNDKGFKCGLCTGKDRERTIEILKNIDFYDCFQAIICSDDVFNPKPHPESLLQIIKLLDVNVLNSIMVGDAKNDIMCAKAAEVACIAVTWGDMDRKCLEKEFPDYIADNIVELSDYILKEFDIGARQNPLEINV